MCVAAFGADLVAEISEGLLSTSVSNGNGAFITNCCTHDTVDLSPYVWWADPPYHVPPRDLN